ncbi:hypothetical protein PHLCEN_2v5568 [Hermanssonia centrifuga]|uniref:Alpha/beta-hydrolase n=1 Tax=Hermanssonia centrifuga TaxID=98765 RepID=A0A2R6P1X3_9APHY|nr:hypothetical protein PHLCEN_2v5568 [Hermanssonia centrifuga]
MFNRTSTPRARDGSDSGSPRRLTFVYKHVHDMPIHLDLYAPDLTNTSSRDNEVVVPAVVWFHGGGLTVGDRQSWFPHWLEERVTSAGIAFITADYRLMPPASGHEVIEDIQDLFTFLASEMNTLLLSRVSGKPSLSCHFDFAINPNALAVAGCSAGGLCAYLAAIHAHPKPKALIALYAMGGNFLIPHYYMPKSEVFFRGRELLDPDLFAEFLHPRCTTLQDTSGSPLAYHSADAPIPGYPANPRMLLARLYLQLGTWLDYYTGTHDVSIALRNTASLTGDSSYGSVSEKPDSSDVLHKNSLLKNAVLSDEHLPLFPQFNVTTSWPPCLVIHGAQDTAVLVQESYHMAHLLERTQVDATLRVVEGREHSFDYAPGAYEVFGGSGGLFDEVRDFIVRHILPASNQGATEGASM